MNLKIITMAFILMSWNSKGKIKIPAKSLAIERSYR